MLKSYEYESPEDMNKHLEEMKKLEDTFHMTVAIVSKGVSSTSLIKQMFNGVRFMLKYRKDQERASIRSKFFMFAMRKDVMLRMMNFTDLWLVKSQLKKNLEEIELDTKIYIPFSMTDLITEENLDDNLHPEMLTEDLDLN